MEGTLSRESNMGNKRERADEIGNEDGFQDGKARVRGDDGHVDKVWDRPRCRKR